jgi:hypothetical protein
MSVEERVAIVGAGPVGLLSALGLAQAGIPVIVIERASEIIASPRAIIYHWSVLEGLDRLGLLEEALDVGFAKQDYTYLDFATGEKINYSLDVLDGRTPFPFNLHLGQNLLAGIALRQRLILNDLSFLSESEQGMIKTLERADRKSSIWISHDGFHERIGAKHWFFAVAQTVGFSAGRS